MKPLIIKNYRKQKQKDLLVPTGGNISDTLPHIKLWNKKVGTNKKKCNMNKVLIIFIMTYCLSCKRDDRPPPLTPHQNAAAWADIAAGAAAAELGPGSFFVAAAVSAAWHFDKEADSHNNNRLSYNTTPFILTPTTINDRVGIEHNILCQMYLNEGHTSFNFERFKNLAIAVRPDLVEDIQLITFEYFNNIYQEIKNINFSNENEILNFYSKYINFNNTDAETFKTSLYQINNASSLVEKLQIINNLHSSVNNFSLSETHKSFLKNSIIIGKYSFQLWNL